MSEIPLLLIVIVIVTLVFDFTNGAHDCANAIATAVSTGALPPKYAVCMAALLNLGGALLGTEVAATLGKGIVDTNLVASCQILVLTALIGAIIWNVLTWELGIPSSSSHALIGGLIGATVAASGFGSLNGDTIMLKVLLPLVATPCIGFICGLTVMKLLTIFFAHRKRSTWNTVFKRLQCCSAAMMATGHGLNDAQKTMGVIALALFIFHVTPEVTVPLWVKIACAGAMSLGTVTGGWKIIRTMGRGIIKLEPVNGFAAELSSATIIASASLCGAPVSTTHIMSASIFGVGACKRASAVKWSTVGRLVMAWCITIPASGTVAWLCFHLFSLFGWT